MLTVAHFCTCTVLVALVDCCTSCTVLVERVASQLCWLASLNIHCKHELLVPTLPSRCYIMSSYLQVKTRCIIFFSTGIIISYPVCVMAFIGTLRRLLFCTCMQLPSEAIVHNGSFYIRHESALSTPQKLYHTGRHCSVHWLVLVLPCYSNASFTQLESPLLQIICPSVMLLPAVSGNSCLKPSVPVFG